MNFWINEIIVVRETVNLKYNGKEYYSVVNSSGVDPDGVLGKVGLLI